MLARDSSVEIGPPGILKIPDWWVQFSIFHHINLATIHNAIVYQHIHYCEILPSRNNKKCSDMLYENLWLWLWLLMWQRREKMGFNMGLLIPSVSFRYFTSGFFSQSSFRSFVVSVFFSFLVSGCFWFVVLECFSFVVFGVSLISLFWDVSQSYFFGVLLVRLFRDVSQSSFLG